MAIDTEKYRKMMEARLVELDKRLHHIEDDLDKTPSRDWEDRATEREDDEVLEDLGMAGLQEMDAIRHALHRIEDGTYGECLRCGEEIIAARLDLVPQAALCRNCAQAR